MTFARLPLITFCLTAFLLTTRTPPLQAQNSPAAQAGLRLLESGRVPPDRQAAVVRMICERGKGDDLQAVFHFIATDDKWSLERKQAALEELAQAAQFRKVKPSGDLAALEPWIKDPASPLNAPAIELAGLWRQTKFVPLLADLVRDDNTNPATRSKALAAMLLLDRKLSVTLVNQLADEKHSLPQRMAALPLLATVELKEAARLSASILKTLPEGTEPAPCIDPLLEFRDGNRILSAELQANPPSVEVAVLVLRHLTSIGRSEEPLSRVLSDIVGVGSKKPLFTPDQIEGLVKEIAAKGDAKKGEAVFRRNDLGCYRCHSIHKAGGDIGPELSSVGAISPLEFLVHSVNDPDQAIKEAYVTMIVATDDGRIHQGIVASRDASTLLLRDANGKLNAIPIAEIDVEQPGKSLMPQGLTNLMTRDEFVDLVAFLSSLGKPGENEIRKTPRFQRFRMLTEIPKDLAKSDPSGGRLNKAIKEASWVPIYALANGNLPLNELIPQNKQTLAYVYGEVNCTKAGNAVLTVDSMDGLALFVDGKRLIGERESLLTLTPGIHTVVFKIDRSKRPSGVLRAELLPAPTDAAEYTVVDGL
ncbi:hypothetical protein [Planctomicrobium sp. SH664]|uniref:hypothetical protein n=1 Tax=Planctomicrobium sp. SH664 TaxID=3448125 RepID=UPI003F5BF2AD